MTAVSTIDLEQGRANQKWRTRQELLRAAGELIRNGKTPTVAEVADHARVSRTTAYRYFPTQESLLEWGFLASLVDDDLANLNKLAEGAGAPEERLDAVFRYDHQMTLDKEAAFRAMLRASLAP